MHIKKLFIYIYTELTNVKMPNKGQEEGRMHVKLRREERRGKTL